MEIKLRKTCLNCQHYDRENDICKKYNTEAEAWKLQTYTCCELKKS